MRQALRRYRCARCGQLALVCSGCEHNQIYCNRGCSKQARLESQRRAGARHQRTRIGRRNHADRQAAYRRRQLQKVTHHTPHESEGPLKPCLSGPTSFLGLPAKEDSDVLCKALPVLPLASVRALAAPSAVDVALPPSPSPARPEESQGHVCHFCQRQSSPYLRRDFLVDLSRRSRGRRNRRPP